jgi:hypothetical protein
MRQWISKILAGALPLCWGLAAPLSIAHALEGGQSHYLKGYRDFLSGVMPPVGVLWRNDLYSYSARNGRRSRQAGSRSTCRPRATFSA